MDVLFLCGVFAKENEVEVIAQAKKSVEFSANQMQLKLIRGLKEAANTQVISAPFIGHYPNQSRSLYFWDSLSHSIYASMSCLTIFGAFAICPGHAL